MRLYRENETIWWFEDRESASNGFPITFLHETGLFRALILASAHVTAMIVAGATLPIILLIYLSREQHENAVYSAS